MIPSPGETLESLFDAIWDSQKSPQAPAQDLKTPNLLPPPANAPAPPSAAGVAEKFAKLLGWPDWAQVFPRPAEAVVAASKLAAQRAGAAGVMWVAPGTGAPLECHSGPPGLAVLRADWAPDAQAMQEAQEMCRERGMLILVDETASGFRLAPGGAAEYCGLSPDMVLYGASLAGGKPIGVLAGRGPKPADPQKAPKPEALAAMNALLPILFDPATAGEIYEQGEVLRRALKYFKEKARLRDEVEIAGPSALPRLTGPRVFGLVRLAADEGLALGPLLMLKPGMDAPALFARLARSLARLKATPKEAEKPEGWSLDGCKGVEKVLASLPGPEGREFERD